MQHGGGDGPPLFRRHVIELQGAVQEAGDLGIHGEIQVAGHRHVSPHDAGGGDVHLVEILGLGVRQVGAEDGLEPGRRAAVDVGCGGGQGIAHHIQLPQGLRQLRDVELEGDLHSVEKHRVLLAAVLLGQVELAAEHPPHQL